MSTDVAAEPSSNESHQSTRNTQPSDTLKKAREEIDHIDRMLSNSGIAGDYPTDAIDYMLYWSVATLTDDRIRKLEDKFWSEDGFDFISFARAAIDEATRASFAGSSGGRALGHAATEPTPPSPNP